MEVLSGIAVELDEEVVLPRLRVREGSEDVGRARELLEQVRERVNAKAIYDLCAVEERGSDKVEIGGATGHRSRGGVHEPGAEGEPGGGAPGVSVHCDVREGAG